MTKLMARAYCAFNTLAFLAAAAACGFLCWHVDGPPALAAAAAGAISILCALVNASAVCFISQARVRRYATEETAAEKPGEKPTMTPGQLLANERWGKRRA